MVIDLELKHISSVESSIKKTVSELERRKFDYEGIVKDLSKISSTTSDLSNSNIYIKKKNMQLQEKIDKLNSFKNKVSTFSSNAKAADVRVATYVTDESNTFYKTVGIKTGWATGWESFKKGARKIWKTVTNFYEKHKYVIDLLIDVALLAVAVVSLIAAIPTGGATSFFAGFVFAQALGDTVTSSVALGYHIAGDDEKAGIWAERGLKDGIQFLGGGLDWIVGKVGVKTDFFRNLAGFAYDVTSIASVGYGLYNSGKGLVKAFKNGNFRQVRIKGIKTIFGINLTPGEKKAGYKAIAQAFSFIKNGKQAYTLVKVCGCVKNVKTTFNAVNSIYNGTFLTDGIKVVKDIKSAWESLKDAKRCAEVGEFDRYGLVLAI